MYMCRIIRSIIIYIMNYFSKIESIEERVGQNQKKNIYMCVCACKKQKRRNKSLYICMHRLVLKMGKKSFLLIYIIYKFGLFLSISFFLSMFYMQKLFFSLYYMSSSILRSLSIAELTSFFSLLVVLLILAKEKKKKEKKKLVVKYKFASSKHNHYCIQYPHICYYINDLYLQFAAFISVLI